jgi:hypothetical protein
MTVTILKKLIAWQIGLWWENLCFLSTFFNLKNIFTIKFAVIDFLRKQFTFFSRCLTSSYNVSCDRKSVIWCHWSLEMKKPVKRENTVIMIRIFLAMMTIQCWKLGRNDCKNSFSESLKNCDVDLKYIQWFYIKWI